ncbi:MAG: integration host factor subunit alpha [Polyangiaceae bacterium]
MGKGTKEQRTTKFELVQAVYSKLGGFSKKEAADLVDLVFELMKETLGRGEQIKISGFGNFVLRDKRARQGRNPQSGEPITITARRVLTFKPSQLLKQALNGGEEFPAGDSSAAAPGLSPAEQASPAASPQPPTGGSGGGFGGAGTY